jgi:hypothetical protein
MGLVGGFDYGFWTVRHQKDGGANRLRSVMVMVTV